MIEDDAQAVDELADVLNIGDKQKAPYHALLEIWREVLRPAQTERDKRVSPQWANRIVQTYKGVGFSDMIAMKDAYFDLVLELAVILELEIETDDECLNVVSPEEDVERNSAHYLNVLFNWQKCLLSHELEWDCASPTAAVEIAVLSEIHKMFFDQTGLIGLLDEIKFEFTDSDRQLLASELESMKNGQEG